MSRCEWSVGARSTFVASSSVSHHEVTGAPHLHPHLASGRRPQPMVMHFTSSSIASKHLKLFILKAGERRRKSLGFEGCEHQTETGADLRLSFPAYKDHFCF